jgi:sensor c-di-GMP phosphodiesterase-like protein
MGQDERAAAVVRATVDIAGRLGMTVVAEGVETDEQLAQLRDLGCAYAQGHLIARPLTPSDLEELLLPLELAPWREANGPANRSPRAHRPTPTVLSQRTVSP